MSIRRRETDVGENVGKVLMVLRNQIFHYSLKNNVSGKEIFDMTDNTVKKMMTGWPLRKLLLILTTVYSNLLSEEMNLNFSV